MTTYTQGQIIRWREPLPGDGAFLLTVAEDLGERVKLIEKPLKAGPGLIARGTTITVSKQEIEAIE